MAAVLLSIADLKTAVHGTSGALLADADYQQLADTAEAVVVAVLEGDAASYASTPEVLEAVLGVAVELYAHRATGGSSGVGVDLSPFRLGRTLVGKFYGLLSEHLDAGVAVG